MDHDLLAGHLEQAERRSQRLAQALFAQCWPGGAGDRTQPVAREWLRRWLPKPMPLSAPPCSCPVGRCGTCN
jgi:hypothetical protein